MPNTEEGLDTRVRGIKARVERNSTTIEKLVDALVLKYARELEQQMEDTRELLRREEELSDEDVEMMTLKVPLFMYFASSGVETLGIQGDNAKAVKMEVFNKFYEELDGTIQDKTKYAESNTFDEYMVEIIFQRAYKKLKLKLEAAEQMCNSVRKVLTKRIAELDMSRFDNSGLGRDNSYDNRRERRRE